ncbi:hypothetical protein HHK36_011797 [Tetracentron sinense]|uniref:MADS-box domain-containing protein n=1 Tax=Tetracentron sinense TaxID=13715 RepID=A0A835DHJ7_TETSI|nr:hypothetical protein HHK36_011797 [Tetracentron sinense]
MGRAKLKIRRLEAEAARQNTFLKRKFGIMKKLHELSVLCDIDCLLLMFPPMGKPILTLGEKSQWTNLNNVNNLAHIRNMEETLVKSLDLFRNQKAEFFPRVPGNNIPPTSLRFINFETQGDTMQFVKHPCVVHPNFVSQVERNYPKQHPESGQEHLFGGIDLYPAGCKFFQFNNME